METLPCTGESPIKVVITSMKQQERKTMNNVRIWEESITIPTYQVSAPDKNPLFFETRVYQGSSGRVYPHPITEKISDEKVDVAYQGVWLENDYLKVLILPQLGGRIQRALDKTNNYDFVYYNHVIKPALVGLTGPWISGGIEFNWPQHHRPSTYMPAQYKLVENEDGSCTVWVSEIDKMYGTKGTAGFTLHPDKAYIEIEGRLFNRTELPQTFLWWANPAVPANDHTYSVFPPDVNAVMDHGKRAVSSFPIATGEYYKYDYSAGVDISRYKNIEVPTSYMATQSNYNFIGNYDESIEAGLLHVANHHISPGKKQWVWGNADFGQAWDRNLTDADGPYVELMTGVFTDNQPDFTWLKPYEEKTFKQYFMPYKGVGRVNNATIDASISVKETDAGSSVRVYVTAPYENLELVVTHGDEIVDSQTFSATPASFYETVCKNGRVEEGYSYKVMDGKRELVCFDVIEEELKPIPEPATALDKPENIKTNEELYLAATHLEQHRHATSSPEPYFLEGLKRDAEDIRINNGYGMLLLRRGLLEAAHEHFDTAITRQTWKSPNPYYGEPLFNRGRTERLLERYEDAYASFYKATWSDDAQAAAFFEIASLDMRQEDYQSAMDHVKKALVKNAHNMKARLLEAVIMKRRGLAIESYLEASFAIDPLDFAATYLAYKEGMISETQCIDVLGLNAHNYLELALDFIQIFDNETAIEVLKMTPQKTAMTYYYLAYLTQDLAYIVEAEKASTDYVFPNRVFEIKVLEYALAQDIDTPHAAYYLGNLFYDKKRYAEAIALWEQASELAPDFATPFRNLSFAYYNIHDDLDKAYALIQKAFECDPSDARILMEMDLVQTKLGFDLEKRVEILEANYDTLIKRDDLYVTYITMLNSLGKHDRALALLEGHQFHPWEGGEGKVSKQYQYALTELAIAEKDDAKAREYLERTMAYPHNLGEGKLPNDYDNIALYYLAQLQSNDDATRNELLHKATIGLEAPEVVKYYHDQPADTLLYQGLAHQLLGNTKQATRLFNMLVSFGEHHIFDTVEHDYFAVSLPETVVYKDDIQANHELYCRYVMGLGYIGKAEYDKANAIFDEILAKRKDYQGAIRHKNLIKYLLR